MGGFIRHFAVPLVSIVLLATILGCASSIPREALQLQPDSLARRQLQTRRYETSNELKLLQASAMVLQDLGFTIDESETKLGVVAASKSRDATDAGQVVGAVLLAALSGSAVPIDKTQNIAASVITRPPASNGINVRVTFQRTVINSENKISRVESLEDPILYQEFFDKLSKAVFLQANGI